MNRLLAVLIAVCYLCASTGITLHEHYCMGEHVSTSIVEQSSAHQCERCGMVKGTSKNDCCKDEHKVVKSGDDATPAKALSHASPIAEATLPPARIAFALPLPALPAPAQKSISGKPHGPPPLSSLRLHVRNCVFLI